MDKLILKYLQKDLTLEEQHRLSKWLEEDEEHRKTLQKMETYWRDYGLDLEDKKQRVRSKLINRIYKEENTANSSFSLRSFIRIAAVILLGIAVSFWIYSLEDTVVKDQHISESFIKKFTQPGEKVTLKLPDGSVVKLNANSSIEYPGTFDENIREVVLHGEAFFDVIKNSKKPFIVHAEKAIITVVGTSFNINTSRSVENVTVGVRTGQVKVSNHSETISRILNPEELIVFNNNDESMDHKMITDIDLIFGWTDQLLVFRDEPFNKILKSLTDWYGIEFVLAKNIDSKRVYTSKFENPTLKTVMESLSYVYDFEYEINGKLVTIK